MGTPKQRLQRREWRRRRCSVTALLPSPELVPRQQPRGHTEVGQEIVQHGQPSFHDAAARHGTASACALERLLISTRSHNRAARASLPGLPLHNSAKGEELLPPAWTLTEWHVLPSTTTLYHRLLVQEQALGPHPELRLATYQQCDRKQAASTFCTSFPGL